MFCIKQSVFVQYDDKKNGCQMKGHAIKNRAGVYGSLAEPPTKFQNQISLQKAILKFFKKIKKVTPKSDQIGKNHMD